MTEAGIVIVGGGFAGLACGVALADRGVRATLLEAAPEAGGRARSCTDASTGDRIDLGPHVMLSQYRNMLGLLERFGTASSVRWQGRRFVTIVDPRQAVTLHTYPLPAPLHSLPDLFRVRALSVRDLLSNNKTVWRTLQSAPEDLHSLDGCDAEWLLRTWGVTAPFIDWYWRTVSMALMNVPLEACSAAALLRVFRHLAIRSDQEMGLPGIALGDFVVPGAVRRIEDAGGCVRTQARVERIEVDAEGVRAVRLADGGLLHARHCVLAVPPAAMLRMLPRALAANRWFARFDALRPSPYISAYLWFDRPLGGDVFWTKAWSRNTCFYDFYDLSLIRCGWEGRPSVIACNLIHSDRAAHLEDDEVIAIARRELASHVASASDARLVHARVHRIPMAIPAPHPGSETLRPPNTTPVRGLSLAGDWTATGLPCSMESSVRSGFLAAERMLEHLGIHAEIAAPLPEAQGLAALVQHFFSAR